MAAGDEIRWHEEDRVQRGLFFLLLFTSPLGVPALGALLLLTKQCWGGFDTEMQCHQWVPLAGYIIGTMDFVWPTMLFGVGLLWIIAAGLLPFAAAWNLYHGTLAHFRYRRDAGPQ